MKKQKRNTAVKSRFASVALSLVVAASVAFGTVLAAWADEALQKSSITPMVQIPDHAKDTLRLHEAMNYAVFNGGKRLRPILLCAAYEMLKNKIQGNSLQWYKPERSKERK